MNEDFQPVDTRKINFTNCDQTKELALSINNDMVFENDENIVITLINVTLTRTMENGSKVIPLSEAERSRLKWNTTNTTVTILDDDSMLFSILYI